MLFFSRAFTILPFTVNIGQEVLTRERIHFAFNGISRSLTIACKRRKIRPKKIYMLNMNMYDTDLLTPF